MQFIDIFQIILFGVLEGITEWLPVSSTGHMLLLDAIFPFRVSDAFKETFFVVIQLGAILAVCILFRKDVFPWKTKKQDGKLQFSLNRACLSLWGKILIGSIPAALLGFLFDDFLEARLHTPLIIALTLIGYGAAFIGVENLQKSKAIKVGSTEEISYRLAFLIGLFQALSLIPGTSRSGATILGALLLGVSRPVAANFSFFLAIPVMFGASAWKLLKFFLRSGVLSATEIFYLFLGGTVAFLVSLIAIKFLTDFVKRHSFKPFGWYRIFLGALVIIFLVLPVFMS